MGPQNAGPEKVPELMKFLHKGECNHTEKVLLVHFISRQLNSSVNVWLCSTSECWFYGPQNAGLAIFISFLETECFLKRWYLRTSLLLLQATLLPHSVHIDKTKEKWIIFHALDKIADFH